MTSQKSLKNNVNLNDFKRSLLNNLIFALIAFVVLLIASAFPLMDYLNNIDNSVEIEFCQQIFIPNGSLFFRAETLLFIGMVCCGVLMAYRAFSFLLSKKQVNVFLSLGVTRKTLFFNRTLASVLLLFISTFLPIFITYLINVSNFGTTALMFKTFIYFSTALFVSGLAGFSICTLALMLSGCIVDVIMITASLSATPIVLYYTFGFMKTFWLNGFFSSSSATPYSRLLTPLSFVDLLPGSTNATIFQILSPIYSNSFLDLKVPDHFTVNMDNFAPLIIWLVVSIIFIAVAFMFLKVRKAENSNSFGHFSVGRMIVEFFAMALTSLFAVTTLCDGTDLGLISIIIIAILICFLVCAIVHLILTRKLKATLKIIPIWAVLTVLLLFSSVAINTEYFGTYNKTPDAEEVVSASIDFSEGILYELNNVSNYNEFIETKNPEDIELFLKIFEEAKDDSKEDSITSISFLFTKKDGSCVLRTLNLSAETYMDYLEKTVNSDFFDAMLEKTFIGFDNNVSKNGKYRLTTLEGIQGYYFGNYYYAEADYIIEAHPDNRLASFNYCDSQGIVMNSGEVIEEQNIIIDEYGNEIVTTTGNRTINLTRGDDLAMALYNDLSKMSFDEIYQNTKKPVGIFGYGYEEAARIDTPVFNIYAEGYDPIYSAEGNQSVHSSFGVEFASDVLSIYSVLPIYEEMTETLKYLEDNGITYEYQYTEKIKEILYSESSLSPREFCLEYGRKRTTTDDSFIGYYDWYFNRHIVGGWFTPNSFDQNFFDEIYKYIDKAYNMIDFINFLYEDNNQPLKSVTGEKANTIVEKTTPTFYKGVDNGRYIYIIYEDGTMACQYLPEANLSVLS